MDHLVHYLLTLTITLIAATPAAARQDLAPVVRVVEDFLQTQTKGLPGQVSFTVGSLDPQNNLAPCPALEASLPPNGRVWGKSTVTVRCRAETGWTLYVPVHVRVMGDHLVSARPVAQGQVLTADDVHSQSADLTALPYNVLTEPSQAIGKTVAISMAAGQPLRRDALRHPPAVKQGQSVKVVSRGPGFHVSTEGRALNNAADGQVAQARITNGQTLSGIARAGGFIEISP